jgi:hypothetical protein
MRRQPGLRQRGGMIPVPDDLVGRLSAVAALRTG